MHDMLQKSVRWFQESMRAAQYAFALSLLFLLVSLWQVLGFLVTDFYPASPVKVTPLAQPESIALMQLFGDYRRNFADLPETQLQLKLEGTEVSLGDAMASRAIVASPSVPTKSYALNQVLPGGAILHKIERDRIILNHNGVLQQLRMKRPTLVKSSPRGVRLGAA